MPWDALARPDDTRHFRKLTLGHTIIMGRRTWEGLPGALPGRTSIVLSSDPSFRAEGATAARSLAEALERAGTGPAFVIGGRGPWEQALTLADEIRLTGIHAQFTGDVHFPAIDPAAWHETDRQTRTGNVSGTPAQLDFITYTRRSQPSQQQTPRVRAAGGGCGWPLPPRSGAYRISWPNRRTRPANRRMRLGEQAAQSARPYRRRPNR